MRMQPYALTVDKFLEHAARWSGDREIVTADAGRPAMRIHYAGLRARSNQKGTIIFAERTRAAAKQCPRSNSMAGRRSTCAGAPPPRAGYTCQGKDDSMVAGDS